MVCVVSVLYSYIEILNIFSYYGREKKKKRNTDASTILYKDTRKKTLCFSFILYFENINIVFFSHSSKGIYLSIDIDIQLVWGFFFWTMQNEYISHTHTHTHIYTKYEINEGIGGCVTVKPHVYIFFSFAKLLKKKTIFLDCVSSVVSFFFVVHNNRLQSDIEVMPF